MHAAAQDLPDDRERLIAAPTKKARLRHQKKPGCAG
jgi:hypothetical protein